jgi:hypothetical protein
LLLSVIWLSVVSSSGYADILPKIEEILDVKYESNPKLRKAAYNKLLSNNAVMIRKFYEPRLLTNQDELWRKVTESLESYERFFLEQQQLYETFKSKVLNWHPHFEIMMENLLTFLWREGKLQFEQIRQLTYSQTDLQMKLTPHLRNFTANSTFAGQVHDAIRLHVKNVVESDKRLDPSTSLAYFNQEIQNSNYPIELLFDQQKIKAMIQRKVDDDRNRTTQTGTSKATAKPTVSQRTTRHPNLATTTPRRPSNANNPSLTSLKRSLDHWYRNDVETNHRVIDFLRPQNINANILQAMATSQQNFISHFETIWKRFLNQKMNEFVGEKYGGHEKTILKGLKDRRIEGKFNMFMAFDLSKLHQLIESEVLKFFDPECVAKTNRKIENYSKSLETSIKIHLTTNDCIAPEICAKKTIFDETFLENELRAYIDAFETSIDEERFCKFYTNIKDEIDESIFDVIESVMTEKGKKDGKCIARYLQRSKTIDGIFVVELLFDEEKLWEKIKKYVRE